MAGGRAQTHHGENDDARRHDGFESHGDYALEAELEPEGKHEEHYADVRPYADGVSVAHRGGVRHVAAGQKTGHDVTQYERLAQTLEKQGNHAGGNENEGQVADERG